MSAILRIKANQLTPTPNFTFTKSEGGQATGSAVFKCRYTDYEGAAIKSQLFEGARITDIHPDIPNSLSYLKLTSYAPEHKAGGITMIRVQFAGFKAEEGSGSGVTDRNTSYSYRGTLTKATILEHPNLIADADFSLAELSALWFGSGYPIPQKPDETTTEIEVIDKTSGDSVGILTDAGSKKWAIKIINGLRYYDRPQLEWSINQSNEGGMEDSDVNDFGQQELTPEGNPPSPDWVANSWWMFSGLSEEKDDDSSSFSRVYTLRHEEYDADLYDY